MPICHLGGILWGLQVWFRAATRQARPAEQHPQVLGTQGDGVLLFQPGGELRQGPGAIRPCEPLPQRG